MGIRAVSLGLRPSVLKFGVLGSGVYGRGLIRADWDLALPSKKLTGQDSHGKPQRLHTPWQILTLGARIVNALKNPKS